MEWLSSYFESIPSLHRTLILVGGISFFWILEGLFPIVRFSYKKWSHSLPNFFFTLTTVVVNLLFAFIIVKASDWAIDNSFGIWAMMDSLPLLLKLLFGLMLLDFIGAWLVHWTEHKVYFMWKFHVIHHSDEHVDTTTALRHHPGESVFRALFTCLAVLVVGAPIWLVMLYQSISAIMSQFNHANLRLSPKVDKFISYLIVTPGMHRIHHHFEQPYSDRNYGNIFSIWDRLTGNYAWLSYDDVKFGLDVFQKRSQNIKDLLLVPVDGKSYTAKDKQTSKR